MGCCDKSKCIAMCYYCKGYEDSYIDGEFSGEGVCNIVGNKTISTNACDLFKCKKEDN